MKKLFAILLAVMMIAALAVPAFADGSDGTITISNAAIGKDYAAYKILDATYQGNAIAYTTKSPALFKEEGSPWTVSDVADANGDYNVQLAAGKTIGDVNTWISGKLSNFTEIKPSTGVEEGGKTATADTITWTGLNYGYYYITSGLGTVVTIDSVKPSAAVQDKNTTNPTEPSGTDGAKVVSDATAQIGDTVTFTITFNATNYITTNETDTNGKVTATTTQVTVYNVADSADGYDYLIDQANPLTVKVGERDAVTVTNATVTQQTATAKGSLSFAIDWDDEVGEPLYNFQEAVVITYKGVVNEFAKDGKADNKVNITNNTNTNGIEDEAETATYNLTINKTDGTTALTGAKFELYRNGASAATEAAAAGTIVSLVDVTSEQTSAADATRYYRVAKTGETGVTTIDMTKDQYSSAVIIGLDGADTYYIKETEAPKGYNKLDAEKDHTMNNANGTEDIVNNAGSVLPSTGGIGTTIFYVIGGAMVLAAGVLLITKKRLSQVED